MTRRWPSAKNVCLSLAGSDWYLRLVRAIIRQQGIYVNMRSAKMQLGVVFPQNEIGADPVGIRDYAHAAAGLGYSHLVAYDHVLGADPTHRPRWQGYTSEDMFHEPFVLLVYLAALPQLALVPEVITLPQ